MSAPRLESATAYERGRAFEAAGALPEALDAYRVAARSNGLAAVAMQACARVQRALGLLEDAVTSATWALHHCQDDARSSFALYLELGDLHAQLGDLGEATYFYRRAARYAPDDPALLRRLRSASALSGSRPMARDIERRARDATSTGPRRAVSHVSLPDEAPRGWDLADWELATG
ncbi:MAG: hypothetical protein AB7S26_26400 [Sandaracinaceae bacterium]